MSKVKLQCDWCGKEIEKYKCKVTKHNFCSRTCLANFSNKSKNPSGYDDLKDYTNMSKHMTGLNEELNPERMTPAIRSKIRNAHMRKEEKNSYTKFLGRHEHRVVAELMLGRPLRSGEVVHHIDRNKSNNDYKNLMVFSSQAEHAKWHAEHDEGGDAR